MRKIIIFFYTVFNQHSTTHSGVFKHAHRDADTHIPTRTSGIPDLLLGDAHAFIAIIAISDVIHKIHENNQKKVLSLMERNGKVVPQETKPLLRCKSCSPRVKQEASIKSAACMKILSMFGS